MNQPLLFAENELFSSGTLRIQEFAIPDATLILYEHFFARQQADNYFDIFMRETSWKQEPITIHGKTHPTPRLTCWYGGERSNKIPAPLTPALTEVKEKIEQYWPVKFTGVLLNYYRSGNDGVSWHRDHDRDHHAQPVIASVSFGETRPFQLRHKFRKDIPRIEIPLNHGSFLLMAGPMQHYWEHQIPKTAKNIGPRINLTFRMVP